MKGMSRLTGYAITDDENQEYAHLKQSIHDILTTPIGSRLMRRDYGSRLADLMDQPTNQTLLLQCYSAIYTALLLWEKRIDISQILINTPISSQLIIDLDFILVDTNQQASMSIPLSLGAINPGQSAHRF